MRESRFIFAFFICCSVDVVKGECGTYEKLFVTGIVCDRSSESPLRDIVCRKGGESHEFGIDRNGRFAFEVFLVDTLYFSQVGYESVRVVIPVAFIQKDYLIDVFMVRDTVMLSEVLGIPRLKEFVPRKYYLNALSDQLSVSLPEEESDRHVCAKMQIEQYAAAIQDPGYMRVGLAIGSGMYKVA